MIDGREDRLYYKENKEKCDICRLASPEIISPQSDSANINLSQSNIIKPAISESDIQEFKRISREKRNIKLNLLKSRARQALKITDLVEKLNAYNKICPLDGIEHSLDSYIDENAKNSRKHRDFI